MLELGEHAEHLQHHPPGWGAGVERLRRRLQDDVELIELLAQPGELTHLAGEAVDAVDEQQVDALLARKVERLLQAGAVEAGPGGLVLVGGDDPPVLHRLAVALQPLPLRLQRRGLVVLVGRDPLVETDSHHRRPPQVGVVVHEAIDPGERQVATEEARARAVLELRLVGGIPGDELGAAAEVTP